MNLLKTKRSRNFERSCQSQSQQGSWLPAQESDLHFKGVRASSSDKGEECHCFATCLGCVVLLCIVLRHLQRYKKSYPFRCFTRVWAKGIVYGNSGSVCTSAFGHFDRISGNTSPPRPSPLSLRELHFLFSILVAFIWETTINNNSDTYVDEPKQHDS